MLLGSVNTFDYALDVVNNNKQNEIDIDKNTYKNLTQDETIEKVANSTALNFNNQDISNNPDDIENINEVPRKKKAKVIDINNIFAFVVKILKWLSPLFVITIITFLLYTYLTVIKNIFPYWYKNFLSYEKHNIFYNIIKVLIFFELFLTLFNHILAVIIKPGNVSDLKKSKYYKTHTAYYSQDFKITKYFLKHNILNREIIWKICKYCNEVKPLRTHHCSICDICVLKMDHHCPWINNCIGQNNQRYFLLFLFHSFCYTFFIMILTLPILLFDKKFKDNFTSEVSISKNNINITEIKYISILSIVSLIIEIFFSGWNWYLAFNGSTTLEFWAQQTGFNLDEPIRNFSFGHWKKNLFYIFGTDNIFKILFFPSIKKLPFSGLEFSRFVDKNFYIDGIQ